MKTSLRISTLFLIGLSACGPVSSPSSNDVPSGPGAWIDAPLDGSTIPLAEYQVVSHASDPSGMSTFELKVNGQVVSTDPVEGDQAGQTIAHISQPWLPPAPGTYLVEIRAANENGDYGPSAFAQVQVGEATEVETPTPVASVCMWTAAVNVFIREGPGASLYPEITAVETGMVFSVVGQSQDQQFWAVEVQPGQIGYVSKSDRFGGVTGDCDMPILPDPSPPPPSETPASLIPQCSDGVDNDGDTRTDFSPAAGVADRECTSAEDNDESVP